MQQYGFRLDKIKREMRQKMDLLYSSTRNSEKKITASQAILKGLADDGGLFVPESIPALDVSVEELSKMSYQQVAYEVMKLFLTDFTEEELKNCINRAYDSNAAADSPKPSHTRNSGDLKNRL